MILLDGLNTHLRQQQRAIPQVVRILSQIGPEERVAVFTLGNTLRTFHAFTSDRASLMAKLARYAGENPSLAFDEAGGEDIDGWFGPPGSAPPVDANASEGAKRVIRLTFEALEQLADHVKGVVYPIDSRDLSVNPRASINQGTMINLADQTGGEAFYNRNDIDRSVRLALDDSRDTYLLTYTPKELVRDGSSHSIRVASTRPGLRLRYRRGYFAPEKEQDAIAGAEGQLAGALSSPLNVSDIGIRASLNLAGGPAGEIGIVVYVDPADLDLVLNSTNWTGALRIEAIQIGAAGEIFGANNQAANLALSPEAYQRALKVGLRFDLHMKREPKASALRIGVVDERGGRAGSLSVPLPAVGQALPPARLF